MLTFAATIKVYLALGATDMRKSFDGLAGSVRSLLAEDPLSGHLFAFCNRRRNMVKIIYWDGAGFWLVAKRLARGTFAWPSPHHDQPSLELRPDQLSALLGGVDLEKTTWQPWWRSSAGESPQLPAPPALACQLTEPIAERPAVRQGVARRSLRWGRGRVSSGVE